MTWLSDALDDIAEQAPDVDLADRVIEARGRRRRTLTAVAAGVMVVATVAGVMAGVRLLHRGEEPAPAVDVDPPKRALGPVVQGYRLPCKELEDLAEDCRGAGWRIVVGTDKKEYPLEDALPARNGPLAISENGWTIAYYSLKAGTVVTRDMRDGKVTAAPAKIPLAKMGSMAKLVISDDGRYVAFSKVPEFKDPAMLFDMVKQRTRLLPNRMAPIWMSEGADRMTLVSYTTRPQLMTMANLWGTASASDQTEVKLDRHYNFSAAAADGTTIVALETNMTRNDECVPGDLVHLDARTGKVLTTIRNPRLPMEDHNVYLRNWRSQREVLALAFPNRTCGAKGTAMVAYALDVHTGKTRKLRHYKGDQFWSTAFPGVGGTP
ncbi:hypothetical protein [Herbidospora cretacea]|uniref:hypothetical protein n=1 Tax=Herbidospora cretacea TaxID=28444 RepID=UPI0007741FB4|nr:hypothetical protein [Herbidospora cretacea]